MKAGLILPNQRILFLSNRVINSKNKIKCDTTLRAFTLMETKALNAIINVIQPAVKLGMNDQDWKQLAIFNNTDANYVTLPIILKETGVPPQQYKDFIQALKSLSDLNVEMEDTEKKRRIFTKFITKISIPSEMKEGSRNHTIEVDMVREVSDQLIFIEKNKEKIPVQYTKYDFEIVAGAKSKFLMKIYMYLASWKGAGGVRIRESEFRSLIGLSEGEYKRFIDLKRRVLEPVQQDLKERADFWFNCNQKGFCEKGTEEMYLNFKIIPKVGQQALSDQADHARDILRREFKFSDADIKEIQPIFGDFYSYNIIHNKIFELSVRVADKANKITSIKQYIKSSLLKEFASN